MLEAGTSGRRDVPASGRGAAHSTAAAQGRGDRRDDFAAVPADPSVTFLVSPVRRGFRLARPRHRRAPGHAGLPQAPPRVDSRLGRALQSFADLRVGDYVVHEDHGVGRLLGFETKDVAGVTRDYLFLAFKGEDRLYVPHEQIAKVSSLHRRRCQVAVALEARREGLAEPEEPRARVRARARGRAARSLRPATTGTGPGARSLERLARAARELVSVSRDRGPAAGDRSGEGGSRDGQADGQARLRRRRLRQDRGGREAAFAVGAERPADTRSLPDDHPRRAALEHLPRALPRLPRARRDGLALPHPRRPDASPRGLPGGKVDVLVGTHRVLSRDVIPKNLGLVVLDEEQRFGVAQKELLRSLRLEVDVLALSATPIPRTLHMSLSGLRDISIIETPPSGRRPDADAPSGEYDEELIKAALEREHARGGQAFYLHNRVESIDEVRRSSRQLCPSLRFLVAHGQMSEKRARRADARVPRRRRRRPRLDHDHRVGHRHPAGEHARRRARRRPRARRSCTRSAAASAARTCSRTRTCSTRTHPSSRRRRRARLATLADHTELGSGFQIAMRDLEIRGARRPARAGAVRPRRRARLRALRRDARRGRRRAHGAKAAGSPPGARGRAVDAYVPAAYVAAEALKIDLHRRIALAEDEDELRELVSATEDRVRAAPGTRREPLRDPGGEAEARPPRGRLPRLPWRPRHGRPGGARLRRGARRWSVTRRRSSTRRRSARCHFASRRSRMRSSSPMLLSRRAWPPERAAFLVAANRFSVAF